KIEKCTLRKGALLKFRKDSKGVLLAVAQKPVGKKELDGIRSEWHHIRHQAAATYIVPGVEILIVQKSLCLFKKLKIIWLVIVKNTMLMIFDMDSSLLEFAWVEVLEKNNSVTVDELAELLYTPNPIMVFGSSEPLYRARLLLPRDEIYFTVLENKRPMGCLWTSIHCPEGNSGSVKLAKEVAEMELQEFIQLLTSSRAMPLGSKPSKSSWKAEDKLSQKIDSLEAFAIDACKNNDEIKTAAENILYQCQCFSAMPLGSKPSKSSWKAEDKLSQKIDSLEASIDACKNNDEIKTAAERKDSERVLLAVAQKPDGKKNWMVSDLLDFADSSFSGYIFPFLLLLFGSRMASHPPSSLSKSDTLFLVVPGVKNFDHTESLSLFKRLKIIWLVVVKNRMLMIFDMDSSLLEFASVELLEKNKLVTVEELAESLLRAIVLIHCCQDMRFISLCKRIKAYGLFMVLDQLSRAMPFSSKPSKSSWKAEDKILRKIESLEAFAIDACKNDDEKKKAAKAIFHILEEMGLPRTASVAVSLLIFPFTHRKDLTHLKVYAIDVDKADELDDALSATWKQAGLKEAVRRGTSLFLHTANYPMFPEKPAMEGMSLKQGTRLLQCLQYFILMEEYTIDNSQTNLHVDILRLKFRHIIFCRVLLIGTRAVRDGKCHATLSFGMERMEEWNHGHQTVGCKLKAIPIPIATANIQLLTSARAMPLGSKPSKSSWKADDKLSQKIESLEAFAIDACKNNDENKTAAKVIFPVNHAVVYCWISQGPLCERRNASRMIMLVYVFHLVHILTCLKETALLMFCYLCNESILKEMGLPRTASAAVNLLIDIGYFPSHIKIDLLKLNIPTDHLDDIILAAESLLSESTDPDEASLLFPEIFII
ncbi:hypothetical protein RJ641_028344, partial [Dillenia turbinata]